MTAVAARSHLLDGRRFDGIVFECGKTAGDADSISFEGGRFFRSSPATAAAMAAAPASRVSRRPADSSSSAKPKARPTANRAGAASCKGARMDATLILVRDGMACGEKRIQAGQV